MRKSLDIAATALTALLLLGFAARALRGLIDPQSAAARIVVAGAILLVSRQWRALAILLSVTAALPLFDMAALSASGITPPLFHPAALVLIAITAALAWRRARTSAA